jgi:hypothetical protein
MTLRACLRLLLLAAMLLAPLGRIGVAQAMAAPSATGIMMAHCAGMPAPMPAHHRQAPGPDSEKMAVDCMIACATMAPPPAPFITPPPAETALPLVSFLSSLSGIQPEADPPPPRFS